MFWRSLIVCWEMKKDNHNIGNNLNKMIAATTATTWMATITTDIPCSSALTTLVTIATPTRSCYESSNFFN
uniref:Uncharacterized protein n=1 Tax=Acrobeloides nanus TaxID=290746 RepID=A0A914EFB4_9BILA